MVLFTGYVVLLHNGSGQFGEAKWVEVRKHGKFPLTNRPKRVHSIVDEAFAQNLTHADILVMENGQVVASISFINPATFKWPSVGVEAPRC